MHRLKILVARFCEALCFAHSLIVVERPDELLHGKLRFMQFLDRTPVALPTLKSVWRGLALEPKEKSPIAKTQCT